MGSELLSASFSQPHKTTSYSRTKAFSLPSNIKKIIGRMPKRVAQQYSVTPMNTGGKFAAPAKAMLPSLSSTRLIFCQRELG